MDIPKFKNEYVVLEEDKCLDDENYRADRRMWLFLELLEHRIANGDMTVADSYDVCAFSFDPSKHLDKPKSVQLAMERTAVTHELEIREFVQNMDVEACEAEIEELAKNYKGEDLEQRLNEISSGYIYKSA